MRAALVGIIGGFVLSFCCSAAVLAQARADGLRKIEVQRFGITVYAPSAWNLVGWAQDDRAFVLRLPQEEWSSKGDVSCELSIAAETLEGVQRRLAVAENEAQNRAKSERKLTVNQIDAVDAKRFGEERAKKLARRLDSLWECSPGDGQTSYELATRFVVGDILYTFFLRTDQAHFDAYRADFEEMLASAQIHPPELSVERLPGGLWMQRDYRFALRLPPEWQPAFGPNDRVLFFARGKARESFTDRLMVMASQSQPLELEKLRDRLQREITAADPKAELTARIIKQGVEPALELAVHTKRDGVDVTTLERRFRGPRCNYEVKFSCEAGEFKRLERELRESLDSFVEVAEPPKKDAT